MRSSQRLAARVSEHRALPLVLALSARARFASPPRRAKVLMPRSRSNRRRAPQMSEHRAVPLTRPLGVRARFAALSARFSSRETFALSPWNIRDLHCYSVCFATPEKSNLVRNLVRLIFAFRAAAKAKRREVAAREYFNLAGPTGLEPATSGVTGR
ncbi:MAG: hypothetical protein ABI779_19110, partial [Acidobacteriota bacterium]